MASLPLQVEGINYNSEEVGPASKASGSIVPTPTRVGRPSCEVQAQGRQKEKEKQGRGKK